LVAGSHRGMPPDAVERGEVDDLLRGVLGLCHEHEPARLRHGLHDEEPGHGRRPRQVPGEERLAGRDVLERHQANAGLELGDGVDE
jgi:hypothetical protein